MTALTVYSISTASSTLSSAANLISTGASGAKGTAINTACTSTAWGEIVALGTATAWAAAGSQGAPTGKGLLWDVTTLENQTLSSGTYTATIQMGIDNDQLGNRQTTGPFTLRYYKRSSGGTYTLIGSATTTSQTIHQTSSAVTITASGVSSMSFSTGDKLYIDLWWNISAVAGTQANNQWYPSSSTSSGWTGSQFVTPGYTANTTTTIIHRQLTPYVGRRQV